MAMNVADLNPNVVLAKIVGGIVVLILIGYGIYVINSWRVAAKANAETVTEQAATISATSSISKEVTEAIESASGDVAIATKSRKSYEAKYREASKSKPVADWGDTPIPLSVRNAACESRQDRDGFTSDGSGGECISRTKTADRGNKPSR